MRCGAGRFLRKGLSFLEDLVFPCSCLHCCTRIAGSESVLCGECLELLELIEPEERCPLCFSADYSAEDSYCEACAEEMPIFDGIASAFDYVGPVRSLIRCLKYSNMPYLSRGIAAYLGAQISRLHWPWPDVIVPVPISLVRRIERGYNQSELLARRLGKILNVPVVNALWRRSGDFSQVGLSQEMRQELSGRSFVAKRKKSLEGKSVVIVDDVTTTGATLTRCAEKLFTLQPTYVFGLTVCHAVRSN